MTYFFTSNLTGVSLTFKNCSTKITFRNLVYSALCTVHAKIIEVLFIYLFIVSMISALICFCVDSYVPEFQCRNQHATSIIPLYCNELHILHIHVLIPLYLHSLFLHIVHRNNFTLLLLFDLFLHRIKYIPRI